MKRKLKGLSQRYPAALRQHLPQGPRAIPPCGTAPAHDLECQAAALDLETLGVARIHETAHLQHLPHRILSAPENKRKKINHDLQDVIARTLLGINVRLCTVKKAAGHNTSGLKKEIASTQLLVEESVQSINRFARELDIHQQA